MTENNNSSGVTFGQFGKSFQEKLCQALLTDHKWAEQMSEVIDVSYFELNYLKFLADRYFAYARKYKVFPTLQLLVTIIRDDLKTGTDIILRDQIVDYLQRIRSNPDPGDLGFVKDKSLEFCRKQSLKKALEAAVDQMEANKYESIVDTIRKAVQVGTTPSVGHDFFNEMDARFTRLKRDTIPTRLPELDKKEILNGGSGKGDLLCVVGSTGSGKCSVRNSYVHVKYTSIKINGIAYKPWDKVNTTRGRIFARDVIESDNFVIEHCDKLETILLGDLFDSLGFHDDVDQNDNDGDTLIRCEWPIEVLSLDGYYPIEALRWTKPEPTVTLTHLPLDTNDVEEVPFLKCSPEHLVLRRASSENSEWVFVRDLLKNDVIMTTQGLRRVLEVSEEDTQKQRLCDLQVAIAHSYYTNGVLSHNSHFLTMIGANALREGKNVLHYTFELSETSVGIRYDSNLCDIDSNEIIDRKEDVKASYENMRLGRLFIKEYPTNTATVGTIRAHVERLSLKGFVPDMIIIDYADIMRSSRQFDSLRHELKLVYEELRGLAMETNIPIWTASQSNREGANSDVIDMTNMSEAYGKAMICDFIVSVSRKPQEKASGWGRLYIAKNRAGRDGLVYPVKMNTARSKFEITGNSELPEEARATEESDTKKRLLEKWKEVKREFPEQIVLSKTVS